jgi:hypothetical protein
VLGSNLPLFLGAISGLICSKYSPGMRQVAQIANAGLLLDLR